MGLVCNNYGTFIVPPSYCEVEDWRDGGGTGSAAQNQNTAPSYEQATATSGVEHRMLRDSEGRFALRLRKHRTEVVVSEMGDEEARARGLCEGDVVTHLDGRPLRGSLQAAAQHIERAGSSLLVRVRSVDEGSRHGTGHLGKSKCHVVQHVVRQGDSVETLAELYHITSDQLRTWNRKHFPVGEPGFLFPGQILTLRTKSVGNMRDKKKMTSSKMSKGTAARRRKSEGDGARRRMLYEVREGDSLKVISARLGVKEEEVRGLNRNVFPIGEAGTLIPGHMLTVFATECNDLSEEGNSALEECERVFMRSLAGRKTRSSFSVGTRGAGVVG